MSNSKPSQQEKALAEIERRRRANARMASVLTAIDWTDDEIDAEVERRRSLGHTGMILIVDR